MGSKNRAGSYSGSVIPNLTDSAQLSSFLRRHHFVPKKALGQHWLVSERVVSQLVDAASGMGGYCEIGPGAGVMTQRISELGPTIAIDIDARSESALRESAPRCDVIIEDILEVDFSAVLSRLPRPRCVVSNLPYMITAPILELLDTHRAEFDRAVLLMQKEVAEKITAVEGASHRGGLSVVMQHQFELKKICDVEPGAFMPPPNVSSTALRLTPSNSHALSAHERMVIRNGFQFPRKTLANNLSVRFSKLAVIEAVKAVGLQPNVRPQFLSDRQWVSLAGLLHSPSN